jgi:hypothetical protein
MTREEPSLETSWLQNIRTMDKVQIIEHSRKWVVYTGLGEEPVEPKTLLTSTLNMEAVCSSET